MLKNTSLAAAFSAITLCSVSICNAEEILKPEVGTEENIAIEKKEGVVPRCQVNPDTKIFFPVTCSKQYRYWRNHMKGWTWVL